MEKELIVESQITINAPVSKVWDALTNPEQTKKYMFGCKTVSNWKVGSTLLWVGTADGKEVTYVKGNIINIEPDRLLAYTVFDPNNSSIPDIPENYLTVTYTLSGMNGQTILTVTQGDYSKVADGEKRYNDTITGEGWYGVLKAIKQLVEESK